MKLGGRGVKHLMPMISHACLQHRFNPALVDLLPAWFRCKRSRELDAGCLYHIILMAVDFRLLRAKIAPLRTLVGDRKDSPARTRQPDHFARRGGDGSNDNQGSELQSPRATWL